MFIYTSHYIVFCLSDKKFTYTFGKYYSKMVVGNTATLCT